MPNAKSKLSFTTVEVIFVLILISVWLAVALPRLGAGGLFGKTKLKSTAYNVASDIRYARTLAISNAVNSSIVFDCGSNHNYVIYKDGVQVGEAKKIPEEVGCSGENQFIFTALGSATAGAITFTLPSGQEQYKITVVAATGTAYVEKQ